MSEIAGTTTITSIVERGGDIDSRIEKAISDRKLMYEEAVKTLNYGGFEHVYDGGHHSVYCNGYIHLTIGGGHTKAFLSSAAVMNRCNCSEFKGNSA